MSEVEGPKPESVPLWAYCAGWALIGGGVIGTATWLLDPGVSFWPWVLGMAAFHPLGGVALYRIDPSVRR